MNIRKVNNILGYGFFIIGSSRIILIVLALIQFITNLNAIFKGNSINEYSYTSFALIIGFTEIILALGSIIMIFINIKKCPQVILGYLLGLGALFFEFFIPFSKSIYSIFIECAMCMSAGVKITKNNLSYVKEYKTSKQTIKNTEWFYSDESENDKSKIQKQNRIEKLEKNISEWKDLLDLGEIDEETYEQEINKIREKQKKIISGKK